MQCREEAEEAVSSGLLNLSKGNSSGCQAGVLLFSGLLFNRKSSVWFVEVNFSKHEGLELAPMFLRKD